MIPRVSSASFERISPTRAAVRAMRPASAICAGTSAPPKVMSDPRAPAASMPAVQATRLSSSEPAKPSEKCIRVVTAMNAA